MGDHARQTSTSRLGLLTGHHLVVVEFYEDDGLAVARLRGKLIRTPDTLRLARRVFNNMTLSGAPALMRKRCANDFNWGMAPSAPGVITADKFSAHWTRLLDLPSGSYRSH